jgi:hypothetical protein
VHGCGCQTIVSLVDELFEIYPLMLYPCVLRGGKVRAGRSLTITSSKDESSALLCYSCVPR